MKNPVGYIYEITCSTTKKAYIGLTTMTVEQRWRLHLAHAFSAKSPVGIKAAINKYGKDDFIIRTIDKAFSINELIEKEITAIKTNGTRAPKGYNLTDGGELSSGTPIIVNQISYSSITKAALAFDIPYKLVWSRLAKGNWSIDESFELVPPPRQHKSSVEVYGEKFSSISDVSRIYGLCNKLVWSRLDSGWTIEEAIELEPSPISFEFEGKYYKSRAVAARKFGLEPHLIANRIKNRWTLRDAFNLDSPPNNISIDGKSFSGILDACMEYNVSYGAARSRVTRGWTYEQALKIEEPPIDYSISVLGISYPTVAEACRVLAVTEKTVRWRLKSGWTILQAFNI